ncbi:hypothetical protein BIW11_03889 [Tropilaelaps mercedesae]|uniref:Cystatin domain-containing protein n=1 Tax=Tropilaelaps mercedesae TaxID=418985 RepID=A0A1V9XET7_9ACAR|nr:hypothetical protein BIW11_03889 [Tropilaelaps mercedesae]
MNFIRLSAVCGVLLAVFASLVNANGEYHADEGGKFSAFKIQTDFAEQELRKFLGLKSDDEVHIASVALQIRDGHLFNVTMAVKSAQSCSVVVHEREEGKALEIIKEANRSTTCVDLPPDDTKHEVTVTST